VDVAGVPVALIARHCVGFVLTFSSILATFLCRSFGSHFLCRLSLHLVSLSLLVAFVALCFGVVVSVAVAVAGAVFVAIIRCFSFFGLFLLLYFWRHFNVITVVSENVDENKRYS